MAQQCFMFLDWGDGWVAVNDHDNDVAALDGFSIQWGTDGIDQQPEPSVMTFRLRDSTGWLTGRALRPRGIRRTARYSTGRYRGFTSWGRPSRYLPPRRPSIWGW